MVGVGITVYYPDYILLEESIRILKAQDCEILLFSNMGTSGELEKIAGRYHTDLICSDRNIGVSGAFNRIMEYFEGREAIEWVMLLDQDSVCSEDYIKNAEKYFDDKDAGIICPVIDYEGAKERKAESSNEFEQVDWCISSGSFNRISGWRECGGFDERLFIDWVDLDYCLNITSLGYRIVRMNAQHLKHRLGNLCEKRFLWKKISVMNHSAERQYYYVRNAVICCRKYKTFSSGNLLQILLSDFIKICFFEKDKPQKLSKFIEGLKAGIKTQG